MAYSTRVQRVKDLKPMRRMWFQSVTTAADAGDAFAASVVTALVKHREFAELAKDIQERRPSTSDSLETIQ